MGKQTKHKRAKTKAKKPGPFQGVLHASLHGARTEKPYGSSQALRLGQQALLQGLQALRHQQYDDAAAYLKQSLTTLPPTVDVLECYLEAIKHSSAPAEESIWALEKLCALRPMDPNCHYPLMNLYLNRYQVGTCLRWAKRLAQRFPSDSRHALLRAESYARVGRYSQALQWLERYQAALLPAELPPAVALLKMDILIGLNRMDEALIIGLATLERAPEPIYFMRVITSCIRMGKNPQAIQLCRQLLAVNPNDIETLEFVATLKEGLLSQESLSGTVVPPDYANPTGCVDVVMVGLNHMLENGGGHHSPQIARELAAMGHRVMYTQIVASQSGQANEPFPVVCDLNFNVQELSATPYQQRVWEKRLATCFPTTENDASRQRLLLLMHWSPYILSLLPFFKAKGFKVVYWAIDNLQGLNPKRYPAATERVVARSADVCLASARHTQQKLNQYLDNQTTVLIPNGFSTQQFGNAHLKGPCPEDMHIGEKTLIFWGGLALPWMDWAWMSAVVKSHPQWAFNFIGPRHEGRVQCPELEGLAQYPNVHFLGVKPVHQLAAYGAYADAGLIHFKQTDLTQCFNPVKAFEYLACGLPILATPMPELAPFPYTWQLACPTMVDRAMAEIERIPAPKAVIEGFLAEATWHARAQALLDACSR